MSNFLFVPVTKRGAKNLWQHKCDSISMVSFLRSLRVRSFVLSCKRTHARGFIQLLVYVFMRLLNCHSARACVLRVLPAMSSSSTWWFKAWMSIFFLLSHRICTSLHPVSKLSSCSFSDCCWRSDSSWIHFGPLNINCLKSGSRLSISS